MSHWSHGLTIALILSFPLPASYFDWIVGRHKKNIDISGVPKHPLQPSIWEPPSLVTTTRKRT